MQPVKFHFISKSVITRGLELKVHNQAWTIEDAHAKVLLNTLVGQVSWGGTTGEVVGH